ncbi:MAG TPA: hypothetical protein V6D08_16305 [Candidatus Obscuribacterales bacterium]
MAKRNKTHVVQPPRDKKGALYCGTITLEDQLKAERAARRQAQIESGTFVRGGVHGGGKRERNRRDRRDGRQQVRNWPDE